MTQPDSHRTSITRGCLTPSPDTNSATWIVAALRDFDHTVGSLVPPVFDDYARVFHPASRGCEKETVAVRWTDVARATGRVMHPAVEWGSLTGSWAQQSSAQPGLWDSEPATGRLPRDLARRLAVVLSAHTVDPTHGHFGVWDGWGVSFGVHLLVREGTPEAQRNELRRRIQAAHDAEVAAWRGLLDAAAAFDLPDRKMFLLNGPLSAIEDFYKPPAAPLSLCVRDPPSLWWPADRRWCVATDVDLMTTYVGGTRAAIDALRADEHLETLAVSDAQSITWEADTINPLPPPP